MNKGPCDKRAAFIGPVFKGPVIKGPVTVILPTTSIVHGITAMVTFPATSLIIEQASKKRRGTTFSV